jgi:hypothetical protein
MKYDMEKNKIERFENEGVKEVFIIDKESLRRGYINGFK